MFDKEEDVVKVCKSTGWSIFETDCEASTETISGHTYNVPALDYNQTSTITSQTYAITNGQATSDQDFFCNDGSLETSGGETETVMQCTTDFYESE